MLMQIARVVFFSFLRLNNLYHISLSIHLVWTFGFFHVLAVVSNAIVDIRLQASPQDPDFSSFGCMSRSSIAGSYSSTFNFLSSLHTVFHSTAQLFIPTNGI